MSENKKSEDQLKKTHEAPANSKVNDYIEHENIKDIKKDKLNVSNYSSNILQESLNSQDSRTNSINPREELKSNDADEFLPPKGDDEYDIYRHRNINDSSKDNFSNTSLVANYGDSDLYPLGTPRPNLNTPFPNMNGGNHNGPLFDPFGTNNNSNSNIRNGPNIGGGGGMIFDPFKNKPQDNKDRPGYSGYPGAKYDYPFGNFGNNNNNNNGGGGGFI